MVGRALNVSRHGGRRFSAVAATVLACALWSAPAFALSEQAEIDKARAAFVTKNYHDVETRLRHLLEGTNLLRDPINVAQARMFLGAALVEQRRESEAIPIFERILLDDAQFDPDPLTFPSKTLEVFIDTRAQMRDRLAAKAAEEARRAAEQRRRQEEERQQQQKRLATLEKMAGERSITVKHSRLIASLPFGVGQFQNGQTSLGVFFLATEAALVLGSAITVPLYVNARARQNEEIAGFDLQGQANGYRDRALDARTANIAFNVLLAVTAAAGIAQAHVAYVPQSSETRKRPIPPPVTIRPQGGPVQENGRVQGATFGLTGSF